MKKRAFHSSVSFSILCGTVLFAAVAAILSYRAEGRRVTFAAVPAGPDAAAGDSALLPSREVLEGWEPEGAPAVHSPQDLFELINGGADLYVEYGFRKLLHAEYRKASDSKLRLTVELYDMGTPEGAFGIYSYERGDRLSNEEVGDEGILSSASLAFRRGRYFVKIETNDLSGAAAKAARPVAAAIAAGIPGPSGRIEALELFPKEGLVAGSPRLILQGATGFPALGRAYLADYTFQGRKGTFFFSVHESAERAVQALEKLRADLGDAWTAEPGAGPVVARAREGKERLAVRAAGRHVAGIRGELDETEMTRILDRFQDKIGR